MPAENESTAGWPADDWDAAKDFLLDLARQPENIKRLAAIIGTRKAQAVMEYARKRREWDETPMPCGHVRRQWVPKDGKSAQEFIDNPEQNGLCVVCEEIDETNEMWIERTGAKG